MREARIKYNRVFSEPLMKLSHEIVLLLLVLLVHIVRLMTQLPGRPNNV